MPCAHADTRMRGTMVTQQGGSSAVKPSCVIGLGIIIYRQPLGCMVQCRELYVFTAADEAMQSVLLISVVRSTGLIS